MQHLLGPRVPDKRLRAFGKKHLRGAAKIILPRSPVLSDTPVSVQLNRPIRRALGVNETVANYAIFGDGRFSVIDQNPSALFEHLWTKYVQLWTRSTMTFVKKLIFT
jgi:hypothetical protein